MKTRPHFELIVMGRTVRLGTRTVVMGVLNATPDSFSDGGLYLDPVAAIARGIEMVRQGADWIDVGGESTRPGSAAVSPEEEAARVLPVIRELRRKLPSVPISIDTTKASVAKQALDAGACILNDISGLRFDPLMAEMARRNGVPLILMHIRGTPMNMQRRPFVRNIWRSLAEGLSRSVDRALAAGVRRSQLIVDPGLGFGKTRAQNFEIIAHLDRLQHFRLPILVGSSRKSFVRAIVRGEGLTPKTAGKSRAAHDAFPTDAASLSSLQFGDAAAIVAAIINGAHIVRVHDLKQIVPAVRIADAVVQAVGRGAARRT